MAEKWDTICNHDENKINEIMDLVNIQKASKILDVGTGTGVMIPFLLSRIGDTGEITAVDISDKMIEAAKNKFNSPNVHFTVGDVFSLSLPAEHFDIVMCYSVFPHLEYKVTAAEKLGRFLKPGGKIVICHSQSRDEINNLHKSASQEVSGDYLPDASTIKGYFLSSGFNTVVEADNERMFLLAGQKA